MNVLKIIMTLAVVAGLAYCVNRQSNLQSAEKEARASAEAIVSALQAHKTGKGVYPAGLKEIGFDQELLRSKWNLVYRLERDGAPVLLYSAQNMPLAAWHYDFGTRATLNKSTAGAPEAL